MTKYAEKTTFITGLGQSALYRKPTIYPFQLAVEACELAVADAGLTMDEIDGAACFHPGTVGVGEGMAAASIGDIAATLNLKLNWFGAGDNAAQFSPVMNAIAAIAAGYCKHVLVWRAVGERWVPSYSHAHQDASKALPRPTSWKSWLEPYWAPSASNWLGIHASVHMHKYGITREQMAAIPIVERQNAALNPKALYRAPLTLDMYMNARMISTPSCLYDCDVPCDGATAIVISRGDLVKDMPQKPIRFEAIGGGAQRGIDDRVGRSDFPHMMMHDAAKMMWSRTDLAPKDVDSAHLYDGFTFLTLFWLEALGFCKEGESGSFVEGGSRISLGGELPLNSNGGQLSEGRTHGLGHLHEAVLQLRGHAMKRQIPNTQVALISAGGGSLGGCILLTTES